MERNHTTSLALKQYVAEQKDGRIITRKELTKTHFRCKPISILISTNFIHYAGGLWEQTNSN